MPGENYIITLAQAKEYLKIADTSKDEMLTGWIDVVSSGIEKYCQCKFKVQTVIGEIHDGNGGRVLFPRFIPLVGLANNATADLQYRNSINEAWQDVTDSVEHIYIDPVVPFVELLRGFFPRGRKNIRINYKCGFDEIPGDIQQTALEMVQMMWNESKQGGDWLGRASKAQPESGTSRHIVFKEMQPRWRMVMERYRRFNH